MVPMPATELDADTGTEAAREPRVERCVDVDDAGAVSDADLCVADQRSLAQDVGPGAAVDVA